jgi:hypothetical protein
VGLSWHGPMARRNVAEGTQWAGTCEWPTGTKSCAWTGDREEGQPWRDWVTCPDQCRGNLADATNSGRAHGKERDRLGKQRGRLVAGGPAWAHGCELA